MLANCRLPSLSLSTSLQGWSFPGGVGQCCRGWNVLQQSKFLNRHTKNVELVDWCLLHYSKELIISTFNVTSFIHQHFVWYPEKNMGVKQERHQDLQDEGQTWGERMSVYWSGCLVTGSGSRPVGCWFNHLGQLSVIQLLCFWARHFICKPSGCGHRCTAA